MATQDLSLWVRFFLSEDFGCSFGVFFGLSGRMSMMFEVGAMSFADEMIPFEK